MKKIVLATLACCFALAAYTQQKDKPFAKITFKKKWNEYYFDCSRMSLYGTAKFICKHYKYELVNKSTKKFTELYTTRISFSTVKEIGLDSLVATLMSTDYSLIITMDTANKKIYVQDKIK